MIKSLKARGSVLAKSKEQLKFLNEGIFKEELPTFRQKLQSIGKSNFGPSKIEILQVNIGYMCNQTCKHCHVDAGPDRKEMMSTKHMQKCLDIIEAHSIKTLDITGGAPEMHPDFRWFVTEATNRGVEEIIVRSNLTIILANPKYHDLPKFFSKNKVRVVSSLPFYQKSKTDSQRGEGVFNKSIEALKMLNAEGYGKRNSGLFLDLVYNPSGSFLPGDQAQLEMEFKRNLDKDFQIEFNHLFTITNLPISRFLDYLIASDNYEDYMQKLVESFNPLALEGVMCKNTISVDWEGYLYDCDFNQMLKMKIRKEDGQHLDDYNPKKLESREIMIHQHCYGCTAGAGSSCQGTIL